MANIIKIKSSPDSASGANTPAAGDLKLAELGYSFKSDKLFVGSGDGATADAIQISYDHPTGDGGLHVPANGTGNNGKVLTASSTAGTYTWENTAGTYSLPIATSGVLGGFKVGDNLSINSTSGVLSVADTDIVAGAKTNAKLSALADYSGTPVFTDTNTQLSNAQVVTAAKTNSKLNALAIYSGTPVFTDSDTTYNDATTGTAGLMSTTDKSRLDALHTATNAEDVDDIINTVKDIVDAFNGAGESVNVIHNGSTIDGGTF